MPEISQLTCMLTVKSLKTQQPIVYSKQSDDFIFFLSATKHKSLVLCTSNTKNIIVCECSEMFDEGFMAFIT